MPDHTPRTPPETPRPADTSASPPEPGPKDATEAAARARSADEPERPVPTGADASATTSVPGPREQAAASAAQAQTPDQGGAPEPPAVPAYAQRAQGARNPQQPWQPAGRAPATPSTLSRLRAAAPAPIAGAVLWPVIATGLLSALLLGEGLAVNLLLVAVPAAVAAYFAARGAGRRLRPWTAVWAVGGLAMLAVPALRDAGWPTFLAVASALALGSLTLHGSRSWLGVLLGSFGLFSNIVNGLTWGGRGVRNRVQGSRRRWGAAIRTAAVAVVLLVVFGALFASADAAFADVLGNLVPDVPIGDGPWRLALFLAGLIGALAAAYSAAAPVRWDGFAVRAGAARGRLEWALPLIVLNLLFGTFAVIQLVVLLGGYSKVMAATDLNPAAYARQGFWQLLWATLLTLLVIALALRWAPRGGRGDKRLVRGVLGTLCLLTLVVVASALRRMDLYVYAFGLTRLRLTVAVAELWLGVVLVLIMVAGVAGARMLPRAVAASAAVAVLSFGLASPDGLVAEQNVKRYRDDHAIDITYLRGLSADAVPALDTLPEPERSCALWTIQEQLWRSDTPWYATSWGEARARAILRDRPAESAGRDCRTLGSHDGGDRSGDPYDPY